jgi:hypothetical protein
MAFEDSVKTGVGSRGIKFSSFCNTSDKAEATILKMYGAIFLSEVFWSVLLDKASQFMATVPFPGASLVAVSLPFMRVKFPDKCIFANEAEVTAFQASVIISKENVGGITIELQANAMGALKMAEAEAKKNSLTITPKPDATAARRSYAETVTFWDNRIKEGLTHWKGKLPAKDATALASLTGLDQLRKVLELEAKGFFFSKDKKKTILSSVAAPGTSQHLFMLALDIKEHGNSKVRKIMADFGWFQTVFQDHPHFTYLGLRESDLSSLGLTKKTDGGQDFWVP